MTEILHALTLRGGPPSLSHRAVLQRIAARPWELPALLARYWRAEPRALVGRYLFDDSDALEAFRLEPTRDPATRELPDFEVGQAEQVTALDRAKLHRPVFIISAPRAGSTLLYELLSRAHALWTLDGESHGVIEGIPRLHPAHRSHASHRLDDRDAEPLTSDILRAGFVAGARDCTGRRYLDLACDDRPDRLRLLEKTPENALRVPFLCAAFPDARFIFLHRDPRQNISSILDAWQHDGFVRFPDLPGWTRGRWCLLLPPGWRDLDGAPLSDVAAFQWRAANELALDDLAAVPRDRWTTVEYADLVAAPATVIRRLCDFIGIAVDPELEAASLRALPLSSTTITPPSPIKWRSNPDLRASSLAPLGPLAGRLRHLSTLAVSTAPRPTPTPDPRVRFACFLDDASAAPPPPMAIVHPRFQLQRGSTVPLALVRRARYRDRFLEGHPIAWVEDAATGVLQPFWLPRTDLRELAAFHAGREPPALDPAQSARLAAAGILVAPDAFALRRMAGDSLVADAGRELACERLCRLPSLIDAPHATALARYYRALIGSGSWAIGDDQVARRHGWHNELIARFYQLQLTSFVARLAGEPVKPTYAYSSAYQAGAALSAHADRRQCELTMSLMIDDQAGADPWPLWFESPRGKRSVVLAPGDAVLFRGCELPHWRDAAPPGQHSTMLLFHYVPVAFTGTLD